MRLGTSWRKRWASMTLVHGHTVFPCPSLLSCQKADIEQERPELLDQNDTKPTTHNYNIKLRVDWNRWWMVIDEKHWKAMIRFQGRALIQVPDVKLMQAAEHPNVRSQSLQSKSDIEVIEVNSVWHHCRDNGDPQKYREVMGGHWRSMRDTKSINGSKQNGWKLLWETQLSRANRYANLDYDMMTQVFSSPFESLTRLYAFLCFKFWVSSSQQLWSTLLWFGLWRKTRKVTKILLPGGWLWLQFCLDALQMRVEADYCLLTNLNAKAWREAVGSFGRLSAGFGVLRPPF